MASLRGAAIESGASSVSNWLSLGFQTRGCERVEGHCHSLQVLYPMTWGTCFLFFIILLLFFEF